MKSLARANRILLIVFAAGAGMLYLQAYRLPSFGFVNHDDGVYLVNAKSLAETGEYRTVSLPQEPHQTKYPPLYAALLSLVWKLGPEFPRNLLLLKLVSAVFLFGAAVLWFPLVREHAGSGAAAWIVVLPVALPEVVTIATALLPDTVFAFLCIASVRLFIGAGKPRREWYLYAAAALAGLSLWTRAAGASLVLSSLAALALRRKWGQAAAYAAIVALIYVPWLAWSAGQPAPADPVLAYYTKLSYASGLVTADHLSGSQRFDVLFANSFLMLILPVFLFYLAPGIATAAAAFCIVGVVLRGYFASWARMPLILLLWPVCNVIVALCFMFPSQRYQFPVLTLFFLFFYLGVRHLWDSSSMRAAKRVFAGGLAVFVVAACARAGVSLSAGMSKFQFVLPAEDTSASWDEIVEAARWIRRHTPPDAVLTSTIDPVFYMLTGRKAVRGFKHDQYELYYRYVFSPRPDGASPLGTQDELRAHLIRNRITHIVLLPLNHFAEDSYFRGSVFQLARGKPGALTLIRSAPESGAYLYLVEPEKL